ncbi:MAG: hypothetical protein MK137_09690 [Rickettsiales bacterium]|nr:hypothetical protein [Rickettsiales bacterium]
MQTNICMKKSEKIIYQPRATAAMINQLKDYRMLCQINKITEAVYHEIAHLDHNQAVEFIAEAIYSIAFKQSDASQHVRSYPIHMRDIDSSQNAIIRSIRMMVSLSHNNSSLYYNSEYGDDMNSDPNKLN